MKTIQLRTEKIIQREKNRADGRTDRQRSGKVAAVAGGQGDCSNFEQHELFVWDHNANAGYGGLREAGMMTRKTQKTDFQRNGPTMLAAKEEVEKEKGKQRQTVSASCVAKKAISGRIGQQVVRAEDQQRVKAKTRAKEAKARVKSRTSCSTKVKAKVSVLWSTQTRSLTGRRNLGAQKMAHGTRSEPCPRSKRGALQVECLWRSSHQYHAQGEHSNERAANEEEYERRAPLRRTPMKGRRTDNMFAEKGWTVKMSRKRVKVRK